MYWEARALLNIQRKEHIMLMLKTKFAKFVMGLMVVSVMSLGAVSTVNACEVQTDLDNNTAQEEVQKESYTNYHAAAQFTYDEDGDKILTVTPKSEFRSHHANFHNDAEETPVVDEETPVVVDEETPVVDEETPIVDEETPLTDEVTPAAVETPVVDEVTPAAVETPVEITKISLYDQLVKTYAKLLNLYETLLNNFDSATSVVEEETPVVVEEETPVVDEVTPAAVETPVVDEVTPAAVDTPVVEEETPVTPAI